MATPSPGRSDEPDEERDAAAETGGTSDGGLGSLLRSRPTVFVYDQPIRCELFEMWLSDGTRVVTASSLDEAESVFDDGVAVSLIRNEVDDATKERLSELIAARSPFSRTVVTTDQRVEAVFPGIDYDVCLVEPTTKAGVRETVERLVRRTLYQAMLKRYYDLTAFVTSREVSDDGASTATAADYERARRRMNSLRERLESLQRTFDQDDLDAVLQSLRPDDAFGPGTDGDGDGDESHQSEKHRPDKCVNCGLEWASDEQYRRLGAFVWKCRDCGTVQNLPDPSHRRLARL